jgi:hypothetical protein
MKTVTLAWIMALGLIQASWAIHYGVGPEGSRIREGCLAEFLGHPYSNLSIDNKRWRAWEKNLEGLCSCMVPVKVAQEQSRYRDYVSSLFADPLEQFEQFDQCALSNVDREFLPAVFAIAYERSLVPSIREKLEDRAKGPARQVASVGSWDRRQLCLEAKLSEACAKNFSLASAWSCLKKTFTENTTLLGMSSACPPLSYEDDGQEQSAHINWQAAGSEEGPRI